MAAGCRAFGLRPPSSLSLYVHVPFCRSKCPYCDFFSVPGVPHERMAAVAEEIEGQLALFREALRPRRVETVYVGGGTPSVLPPWLLDRLLGWVADWCGGAGQGPPAEWTMEANPESLTAELLEICARHGVTRLSLGIQSFDPQTLSTLGRAGSAAQCRKALELVAARWPGELSLDLITGVPGQSLSALEEDLETALAAGPRHLSVYSLTLDEPGASLGRPLDPEEQERLWLRARRLLERRGYRNYEISSFALPGAECRHNLRYWNLEPYLGVGPGAASTLPGEQGAVLRLQNPASLERFLEGRPQGWGIEVEQVTPRDFLFECLMMGLRLRTGLAAGVFRRRFGSVLEELLPDLVSRWRREALLRRGTSRYALTSRGRMILNPLLLEAQRAVAALAPAALRLAWG